MRADPMKTVSEANRLRVERIGAFPLACLVGLEDVFDEEELDELGRQLHGLVDETGVVLVSVRGAERLSSGILARLVMLHRRLRGARGRLLICGVSPFLREVLRQCRLDRVLELFTEEGETLANRLAEGWERDSQPLP